MTWRSRRTWVAHRRPLDLDDDGLAGHQRRGVDLGDGCGRDRRALEGRRRPARGCGPGRPRRSADDGERLGRHLIAAFAELGDELLGEDALTGRQDLAHLDVGRAQLLEGLAQPARQPARERRLALARSRAYQPPIAAADERADLDDTAAGRQLRTRVELRDLGLGRGPDLVDALAPRQVVEVDDPRWVVRERADAQIGRCPHGTSVAAPVPPAAKPAASVSDQELAGRPAGVAASSSSTRRGPPPARAPSAPPGTRATNSWRWAASAEWVIFPPTGSGPACGSWPAGRPGSGCRGSCR